MTADTNLLNIYDEDVLNLQGVHRALEGRTYKSHNLDAFEREIVERFQEIGFVVDVKWYTTHSNGVPVAGVFAPVVEVTGRCAAIKAGEFDHDRQRHQVVNNLLGLPEADAGIIPSGSFTRPEPHKH